MRSARPGGAPAAAGRSAAWAGGGGVGSSHVCQAIAAAAAALTWLHRLPPFLPLRRPSLWDLRPWTELACSQDGGLRGAPTRLGRLACGLCTAGAERLWRRLGAGCSAIVTAEQREPGREGGRPFCAASGTPFSNLISPSLPEIRLLGPQRGGEKRIPILRFWEFLLPNGFGF